jgi:hypothetical protein
VSTRSRQAQQLARALTCHAGIPVDVAWDGSREYLIQWGNGPTGEHMSALLAAELAGGQYPDLPPRLLSSFRGYTARAFAARAAAALRDGSLAGAVQAGVAERQRLGIGHPSWSRLSDADHAAHEHIERLLDVTPCPDQASDPADEPVITALIEADGGSEYAMLPALAAPRQRPEPETRMPGAAAPGRPGQAPEPEAGQ